MDNWHWLAADKTNNWLFAAIPAAATVGFVSFYVIYFLLPNRFPKLRKLKSLGPRALLGASALSLVTGMICKFF
jgi:uncharacterized BrkB/YihY/UPF0761 family membrane protein